jgi:prepilin-type N-terminal cleavage/methylation domain-containing protein
MKRDPSAGCLRAFTLTELLVVIAIIGILAAVIIPVVGTARARARQTQSVSNLRQTGVAMALHVGDHRGELPGRNSGSGTTIGIGDRGLAGSVTARYWNSNIDQLATHLAAYVQVTEAGGIEKLVPCLEDPLADGKQTGTSTNPVLWVLNRRLLAAHYDLSVELQPFGTSSSAAPMNYRALVSAIEPGRVWAITQADQVVPADAHNLISVATVTGTPTEPVAGGYRLALFFDWSVGRIAVGTDLRKPITRIQ